MAQAKKRPNKAVKAAQKILADSKLLATHKTAADAKAEQMVKPGDAAVKSNTTANKIRPNKKRG